LGNNVCIVWWAHYVDEHDLDGEQHWQCQTGGAWSWYRCLQSPVLSSQYWERGYVGRGLQNLFSRWLPKFKPGVGVVRYDISEPTSYLPWVYPYLCYALCNTHTNLSGSDLDL
jgi:hypothetical protein